MQVTCQRESPRAGHRNSHQATDEVQRAHVCLFPQQARDPQSSSWAEAVGRASGPTQLSPCERLAKAAALTWVSDIGHLVLLAQQAQGLVWSIHRDQPLPVKQQGAVAHAGGAGGTPVSTSLS